MDINERQIALAVLESLRGDLIYAHLNNGSRVLDVADLRQYIYEQMAQIKDNSFCNGWPIRQRKSPRASHQLRAMVTVDR